MLCCGVGLSLGACSSGGGTAPGAAVTVPAVGRPAAPVSVEAALAKEAFTSYAGLGEVTDDGLAPNESIVTLRDACLRTAGYPGDADSVPIGISISAGLAISPPFGAFGYLGATVAAQYGFMPGTGASGVTAQVGLSPNAGSLDDLPTAAQAAVTKCGNVISSFTDDQQNTSLAVIQSLGETISADVLADSEVKKAISAWSACMAADGFDYSDPNTAFHDQIRPGTHLDPGAPDDGPTSAQKQAQIAVAESDAACTATTDLAGIYFAVQADLELQIVSANQQKLTTAVQDYRAAYQKELADLPTLLTTASATLP